MNFQKSLAVFVLASSMFACTTTERVDAQSLLALRARGPSSKPLTLQTADGRRVRLDPQSKLQFLMKDGTKTSPIAARHLAITSDGMIQNGQKRLSLDDVKQVEVKNVDGVKSYFLTVGIVGVAAVVVAAAMTEDANNRKRPPIVGRPASPERVARPSPRIRTRAWRPIPRHRHRFVDTYDYHYGYWYGYGYHAPYFSRTQTVSTPAPSSAPSVQKLFTPYASRKSTFSMMLHTDAGYSFDRRNGTTLGVGLGVAVMDMFELSGGARFSRLATDDNNAVAYLRAGGNFPLEASDLLGAPIHLELGFNGDGFQQMRVVWGLRFRFHPVELAVLPFNPQLSQFEDQTSWDFPTTLQVAYRF